MQLVTPANSIWQTAAPSVAYAQLSDLVEIMLHPKDSIFATCSFCQTLNRRGATRCRACGASFLSSDESDAADADETEEVPSAEAATTGAKSVDRPQFSDLAALRSMLLLVLVPPILMFLAFFAWNKLRMSDAGPVGLPDRSSIETVFPAPNVTTSAPLPGMRPEEHARQAAAKPEAHPRFEKEVTIDPSTAIDSANIAEVEEERDTQSPKSVVPIRPRPIASHQPGHIQSGNPLAACSGYTFIARAVCVNKSCAQPKAAQHAECKEANRQRRIDESRRNPVLMG